MLVVVRLQMGMDGEMEVDEHTNEMNEREEKGFREEGREVLTRFL